TETFDMRTVPSVGSSGWYVHDRTGDGGRREVAGHAGGPLDRHEIDELSSLALTEGLRAGVAVFAGPTEPGLVPPSTYRRLAADLGANGVRVVADLAGEHLSAAVAGGVYVLKVSHDELVDAGRARDDSLPELIGAARVLRSEGAGSVGAPRREMADPGGAGDSMTAAMAAMLAQGAGLAEAVRMGAAAGAATVTRHGMGTAPAWTVAELAKRVRLVRLAEGAWLG